MTDEIAADEMMEEGTGVVPEKIAATENTEISLRGVPRGRRKLKSMLHGSLNLSLKRPTRSLQTLKTRPKLST